MKNKSLIILTDGLKSFSHLFKMVKEKAFFNVELITFSSLCSKIKDKPFMNQGSSDQIIVIDTNFWQKKEKKLFNCLKKHFKYIFEILLYIYVDLDFINEKDVLIGKKHCINLSHKGDVSEQCSNFILYVTVFFNELILMQRLMGYIYSTFEGVVDSELLKKKQKEIERLNEELERKNKIDSLTRLYNRNVVFEYLERFESFSIMMIDVDDFKKVNDTYGHLMGDEVLRAIGRLLLDNRIFRKPDIVGRFGGEEFIVALPGTSVHYAEGPALRLASEMKSIEFRARSGKVFHVTLSIGLSEYCKSDNSADDIIQRADKALYYSKNHGKDQVAVYEKKYK